MRNTTSIHYKRNRLQIIYTAMSSNAVSTAVKAPRKPKAKAAAPASVTVQTPSAPPPVVDAPKTPVQVQPEPVPQKKQRKVQKAADGTVVKRHHSVASPRTAANAVLKTDDTVIFRDTRAMAQQLARSIEKYTRVVAGVSKSTDGEFAVGGATYTQADVKQMKTALRESIKSLPRVARSVPLRTVDTISPEERQLRIEAHCERARLGAEELAAAIGIPKLAAVLFKNEKARISALTKLSRVEPSSHVSCFYISDPLKEFVRNGNFGNGIALLFPDRELSDDVHCVSGAEAPEDAIKAVSDAIGEDCVAALGITRDQAVKIADTRRVLSPLLIEAGVATSALLMTLTARYIRVNRLKDAATGRIRVDTNMRRQFGSKNTRAILNGVDHTPADASEDVNLDGLARLRKRTVPDGQPVPFDGKTFIRPMTITLASFYRVSKVSDPALAATLASERINRLAIGANIYL